jgi:hypothetical protein
MVSTAISVQMVQSTDFAIADKASSTDASGTPPQQEVPVEDINKPVVDMTTKELRRFDHELSHLKFDPNQGALSDLLKQAGDRVVAFFRDFSNTSSKEKVNLSRMAFPSGPMGRSRMVERRDEEFNYLILLGSGEAGISWVEDRADKKNRPLTQKAIRGYIMSSGYASLCMYLHPSHQANSRFRYLGRDGRKPRAHVIAFTQKAESGDYLAQYSEISSTTPIRYLVQGFVWVDPDNYQIIRMRTRMLLKEKPAALMRTSTDIRYGRVQFEKSRREFWLPQQVSISWVFPDCTYSNRHRYSDYHLFTVESDYQITQPKVGK